MKNVESLIAPLVERQFPDFYREEGPKFIDFVKQYFTWMQQQNQALGRSRSLFNIKDIDKTSEQFLVYFKDKYLKDIPLTAKANTRFLVKNAKEIYRNKGTPLGVALIMRGMFNQDTTVYYPSEDIFKSSDGVWIKPIYIETSWSPRNKLFVGQQLVGTISGATAFCDKVVTRVVGTRVIDIFYISSLRGNFQTDEKIVSIQNKNLNEAPIVTGSLTSLTIINGGANFAVGDIFNIVSVSGKQGKARVSAIASETGRVNFIIEDGGWGYSTNATVFISDKVLGVTNSRRTVDGITTITNDNYALFETIRQDLFILPFSSASNSNVLTVNTRIIAVNSTVTATAGIVNSSLTDSTQGNVVVTPLSGNIFSTNTTFRADLIDVSFTTSANILSFANDTFIVAANSTTEVSAYVIKATNSSSSAGVLLVRDHTGNIYATNTSTFRLSTNSSIIGTFVSYTSNTSFTASMGSSINAHANGIFIAGNTTHIGIESLVNAYYPNNIFATVRGLTTNTVGNLSFVSTGSDASFKIGSLDDEESVILAFDFLGGNNTGNVAFVDINLDLSPNNSNSTGYGFPKFPGADINTILLDALQFEATSIGSISQLTNINQGTNYNINPFVLVYEPIVAGASKKDILLQINNVSGTFVADEVIEQVGNTTAQILTVSAFSGNTANGSTSTSYIPNEAVYQTNGTVNSASARVYSTTVTGGAGTVRVVDVTGTFVNTEVSTFNADTDVSNTYDFITPGSGEIFSNGEYVTYFVSPGNTALSGLTNGSSYYVVGASAAGYKLSLTYNGSAINLTSGVSETGHKLKRNVLFGVSSGSKAQVDSINAAAFISSTISGVVNAVVTSGSNTFLEVKRRSYLNEFVSSVTILGLTSGATANVVYVSPIESSLPIGLNASILANVQVSNNTVTAVTVIDSGFGYRNGELVDLQKANSSFIVSAQANVSKQGVSEGYYASTKGFLSSDKKIFDGDYYQDFSYEVQTKVPFNQYVDILKSVMHVAGTKMFGKVVMTSNLNSNVEIATHSIAHDVHLTHVLPTLIKTTLQTGESIIFSNNYHGANAWVHMGYVNAAVIANLANAYSSITVLTVVGQNNNFINNTVITVPNNSIGVNSRSGVIQTSVINATSNTTSLYVSNLQGFVNSSITTASVYTNSSCTAVISFDTSFDIIKIGTITKPVTSQIRVSASDFLGSTLPGNVTLNTLTYNVIGNTNTVFSTHFSNGDFIYFSNGTIDQVLQINKVSNNSFLNLYSFPSFASSNVIHKKAFVYPKGANVYANVLQYSLPVLAKGTVTNMNVNTTFMDVYLETSNGFFTNTGTSITGSEYVIGNTSGLSNIYGYGSNSSQTTEWYEVVYALNTIEVDFKNNEMRFNIASNSIFSAANSLMLGLAEYVNVKLDN